MNLSTPRENLEPYTISLLLIINIRLAKSFLLNLFLIELCTTIRCLLSRRQLVIIINSLYIIKQNFMSFPSPKLKFGGHVPPISQTPSLLLKYDPLKLILNFVWKLGIALFMMFMIEIFNCHAI